MKGERKVNTLELKSPGIFRTGSLPLRLTARLVLLSTTKAKQDPVSQALVNSLTLMEMDD